MTTDCVDFDYLCIECYHASSVHSVPDPTLAPCECCTRNQPPYTEEPLW